jgi:hypothetical protein
MQKVDQALSILANAIRTGQPVTELPNLQEAVHALQAKKVNKHEQDGAREDQRFVVSAAKEIVSNIQAMQDLLCRKGAA